MVCGASVDLAGFLVCGVAKVCGVCLQVTLKQLEKLFWGIAVYFAEANGVAQQLL